MEPENTPLEGENHLNQTITIMIFGFYVNLRGVPIKQHRFEGGHNLRFSISGSLAAM